MPSARPTVRPRSSPRRVAPSVGGRIQFPKARIGEPLPGSELSGPTTTVGSSMPSWRAYAQPDGSEWLVALDEGPSLALDPTRCLPTFGRTKPPPGITCSAPKRTTGFLRVEESAPTSSARYFRFHEKQQFTRFYRLLQGGLCYVLLLGPDQDFRPTGSNPAERFRFLHGISGSPTRPTPPRPMATSVTGMSRGSRICRTPSRTERLSMRTFSGWGVSSVTNMQAMFSNASLFNQPIGDWNVSSVSRFAGMFNRADAFNQEIRRLEYIFRNSYGLHVLFD